MKVCKTLHKEAELSDECIKLMLFLCNNTPRACGLSPAELLLGRIPHSIYIELPKEIIIEHGLDQRQIQEELWVASSEHRGNLPLLSPGDQVYIFYPFKKSWSIKGELLERQGNDQSYNILDGAGNVKLWNCIH